MNHCSRCDARLRKSKPPWALCDPCDDARHRANIAHEKAQEQARLDAGERPCKHCGQHTAAVRSGIYACVTPSQPIADKAIRLLDQHRVYLSRTSPIARVQGDTDRYTIEASHTGVRCTCQAGANLDPVSCSHKVAAQVLWGAA